MQRPHINQLARFETLRDMRSLATRYTATSGVHRPYELLDIKNTLCHSPMTSHDSLTCIYCARRTKPSMHISSLRHGQTRSSIQRSNTFVLTMEESLLETSSLVISTVKEQSTNSLCTTCP